MKGPALSTTSHQPARITDPHAAQEHRGLAVRVARWMLAHTLRLLGGADEALAMQLDLERQFQTAGETDPYVFEELALLYQARGDAKQAAHYQALQRQASPPGP